MNRPDMDKIDSFLRDQPKARGERRCEIWCLVAGCFWGCAGTVFFYFVWRGAFL